MKKSYWLGHSNLQTEYGYEPSQELLDDVGDDILEINEDEVEFFVTESSDWETELEGFLEEPEDWCESWLESIMRITPIESDFLHRAVPAMAKGFLYLLQSWRTENWDSEYKAECVEKLNRILKGE